MTQSPSLPELPKLRLLVCPFCNGEGRETKEADSDWPSKCFMFIQCSRCGARTANVYGSGDPSEWADARHNWNQRLACYEAGRASRAQSEWQPIATCPQTGFFLVTEDTCVRAMWRYEGEWQSPDYPGIEDVWGGMLVGDDAKRLTGGRPLVVSQGVHEPHHWMPVPEGMPHPDDTAPTQGAEGAAPQAVDDAFAALRALTEAVLTRADNNYLRRQLDAAVKVMAAHGCSPPVPWPDADFFVSRCAPAQAVVGEASEPKTLHAELLALGYSGPQIDAMSDVKTMMKRAIDARAALSPSPAPTAPQGADALREADTPWQLLEMARRVSAAYRDGTLTGHEIRYLDTMIERAEKMPTAARDVMAERRRQVSAEGWTSAHDDEHADGALAAAAGCYARLAAEAVKFKFPAPWVENIGWTDTQPDWPWEGGPKPAPLRRMLVKAEALILAEIERLDRAALAQHQPQQGDQHV